MPPGEIVDDQDFEASLDEMVGGDGADVAGSAGDQDFRHCPLLESLLNGGGDFGPTAGVTAGSKRAITLPLRVDQGTW